MKKAAEKMKNRYKQLRREIGHEYGIGHARILMSACTLMIAIMFTWFLKYAFFDGRITSNIKARKTKGIPQQTRHKPKGNETKKRKKVGTLLVD
ncbi:hypothetical protein ANCCAN_01180 [Ancylostoma caninum]|uniref:Uncharacterized protein n=1 Tax=Ancylostoma caninum TaxID=29170 RepID=A0A368H869_ANCCA|nr:hypothetical protein ANCCAN_01180 [Ancylostoma caninum]